MARPSLPLASLSLALFTLGLPLPCFSQEKAHLAIDSEFGSYVEPGFPFLFQTFDARALGGEWPKNNLTARGVILSPGGGLHVCFDPDMLRIALVWRETNEGEWFTMNGMASASYREPAHKIGPGEKYLPRPLGAPLLATPLVAGWSMGGESPFTDPRDRGAADVHELCVGPLPEEVGLWRGVSITNEGAVLRYQLGREAVPVTQTFSVVDGGGLVSRLEIGPSGSPLSGLLGSGVALSLRQPVPGASLESGPQGTVLNLAPAAGVRVVELVFADTAPSARPREPRPASGQVETVITPATLEGGGLVADRIALPIPNPWKRNVRLSGLDFFKDGRAAVCTFDGDVWIVSGFAGESTKAVWQRFGGGLNEPMGLQVVDDTIYVFDRNGVQRLHDRDGDGAADDYEAFCPLVPQTVETREFAMDLVKKPGGGFYISKGGQAPENRGRENGTVIEIAADGRSWRRLGQGFRQPYIGVDPETGTVTASDQQGNWTPSTPIHIVEAGNHHGFMAEGVRPQLQPLPIREPVCWIPHFVNQSATSQVWLRRAKMGPWNDALLHLGYNRPEVFRVFVDDSAGLRQGAVTPVLAGWPTGLFKGAVNPEDGLLYLCGFKIWGTVASEISGLFRVRPSAHDVPVLVDARSSERGVLLRFDRAPDPAVIAQPASYTVDRWNYVRTSGYGSGHYKLDGQPGQETLAVASVVRSEDGRAVFLGLPDMRPCHTLRVTFRAGLPGAGGAPMNLAGDIRNVFFTVHALKSLDLKKEGFPTNEVDLTVKAGAGPALAAVKPTAEEGRKVYELFGCMGCHSSDGTVAAAPGATGAEAAKLAVGPTWKNLYGAKKLFSDGTELASVDDIYLRESILDPGRKVVQGFEMEKTGTGMPSYLGVLRDDQIESLILYIKSISEPEKQAKR